MILIHSGQNGIRGAHLIMYNYDVAHAFPRTDKALSNLSKPCDDPGVQIPLITERDIPMYHYGDVKDLPSNLGSWAKSSPKVHVIISGTSFLEDVIQLSSQTRHFFIGHQTGSQDITQDIYISDSIKDGIVTGYLLRRKGPGSWR